MNKLKQALLTQQPQLNELLVTNKSLAVQKREFHRQKLRAYSQKAVKLRSILRQTTDGQQKKCLEEKLRTLQQKQDAQITKLAKIDQIEKQIDQFITQENEEGDATIHNTQIKSSKNQLWRNQIENTPADRLRTKSSLPMKKYNNSNIEKQFDFSRRKSSYSKKQQSQEMLLKDSRQALQELVNIQSSNNFTKNKEQQKKSLKSKEVIQPFSSYKKSESNFYQPTPTRSFLQTKLEKFQQVKYQKKISYDDVPPVFLTFVDKVSQFWPKDLNQLLKYFKQSEFNRKKLAQKQKQLDQLALREEKVRRDQERNRKQDDRLKKTLQKLNIHDQKSKDLINQQRKLMQQIDKLQKEHQTLRKQVNSSFNSIAKCAELISSSSFLLKQQKDPVQVSCLYAESVHKFSVDSFDSAPEGSLYQQLAKFQKGLQKYLLSAQRSVMLISGQIQQNTSKMAKNKQQTAILESKKKSLESQICKMDQSLAARKNLAKQLEGGLKKLQSLIKQNNDTLQLKREISQELEQKCEKLKQKKKSLTQKVKKLEEQVQSLTLKKQQVFEINFQAEHRLNVMKSMQKQLDAKIIFCQRDKENRIRDLEQLQKQQQQLINSLRQMNQNNQEISLKLSQKQKFLSELQQLLLKRKEQELSLGQRAQKIQQQLADATAFLEQQNSLAQRQMQQIANRSTQHLQIQSKISLSLALLHQHERQIAQLQLQIKVQKESLCNEKDEIANISKVKQDLQNILHEIMQKKQQLLTQVQERSKQLQSLLTNLQNAKQDYQTLLQTNQQNSMNLKICQTEINEIKNQLQDLRSEFDSQLEQQSNLLRRVALLKEFQNTMLLQIGVKGTGDLLQGQLKLRVSEAVAQLSSLNDIKSQLKQCKYENRKLKLDNQRLNKLLGQPQLTG